MSDVQSPVVVFWRPGCPYCVRLRSKLDRARVLVEEIDIWEHPDAAAFVRSVAGGDETVPTVRLWDEVMVNPSPRVVIDEIRRRDPGLIGTGAGPRRRQGRLQVVQWVVVAMLIGLSFTAEALGHSSLSWALDGVAVASYLVFRGLRRRAGRGDRVLGGVGE